MEPAGERLPYGKLDSQFVDFFRPSAGAGRPLAIVIHGGFWRVRYDLLHATPVCAALAAAGFTAALAMAHDADVQPAFINLGGAWHGIADIERAFSDIRAALGDIEILVEPGRALAAGAGFATGRIVSGRSTGDRVVGNFSRRPQVSTAEARIPFSAMRTTASIFVLACAVALATASPADGSRAARGCRRRGTSRARDRAPLPGRRSRLPAPSVPAASSAGRRCGTP